MNPTPRLERGLLIENRLWNPLGLQRSLLQANNILGLQNSLSGETAEECSLPPQLDAAAVPESCCFVAVCSSILVLGPGLNPPQGSLPPDFFSPLVHSSAIEAIVSTYQNKGFPRNG